MTEKTTYLVTGATGGIGNALVDALSQRQCCHIILAVRNVDRGLKLIDKFDGRDCTFEVVKLDLSDLKQVEQSAISLVERGVKINGLINNAGIMPAKLTLTADGYETATQVNYVATKLFTETLLPSLSEGGCVVFTTSVTRYLGRERDDWAEYALKCRGLMRRFRVYGQSKRLIAAYAHKLAQRLQNRDIRVNCADPGIVDTNMINMGNRAIDALANACFRPLISTQAQGAEPALRALDSNESGMIYTRKKMIKNTL